MAEWSSDCSALKDSLDFESSECLWLLRAWVQIPFVDIFSNDRMVDLACDVMSFSFLETS